MRITEYLDKIKESGYVFGYSDSELLRKLGGNMEPADVENFLEDWEDILTTDEMNTFEEFFGDAYPEHRTKVIEILNQKQLGCIFEWFVNEYGDIKDIIKVFEDHLEKYYG